VSVSRTGGPANNSSRLDAITPDGRFVLFDSRASNLVRGDTNRAQDVFVRNLATGRTRRVSVGWRGQQANGASQGNAITPDGRFILFTSTATNLVRHPDTNGVADVFLRDRHTGRTVRISVKTDGGQYAQGSTGGVLTDDGKVIAFTHGNGVVWHVGIRNRSSRSTSVIHSSANTVPDAISATGRFLALTREDDQGTPLELFLRNRLTGRVEQVPSPDSPVFNVAMTPDARYVAFSGLDFNGSGDDAFLWRRGDPSATTVRLEPNGFAIVSGIPSDGRYVAVDDDQPLVAGDTNGAGDVYRFDMTGGPLIRASLSDTGAELPRGASAVNAITSDGSAIAFSTPSPAVPLDTNHFIDVYARTGL
jgi:Tol biopolymer transport system component